MITPFAHMVRALLIGFASLHPHPALVVASDASTEPAPAVTAVPAPPPGPGPQPVNPSITTTAPDGYPVTYGAGDVPGNPQPLEECSPELATVFVWCSNYAPAPTEVLPTIAIPDAPSQDIGNTSAADG